MSLAQTTKGLELAVQEAVLAYMLLLGCYILPFNLLPKPWVFLISSTTNSFGTVKY